MSGRPARRSMLLAAAVALVLCAGACASRRDLADRLRSATTSDHMPAVVACWERAFEEAGFRGRYLAIADFTVSEDGRLRDVALRSLQNQDSGEAVDADGAGEDLRDCLQGALAETRLPPLDAGADLTVEGYRIAFDDASAAARREASKRAAHVLIGPRANRCAGLFAHRPPRDLTVLQTELADAEVQAERARGDDRDRLARALQKEYDVSLELIERLRLDASDAELSAEARRRYTRELDKAERRAARVGAAIGCEPPR